ncbi:NAD-dependent epimerase/dehydratase family protein [Brachybacterium subflavum]|uniref:NAD-dependent epimerase/dehydratase family protein n=1 Tax=Brachybacterium subflavum TaxID=2585206 RepID=UPI0012665987|nr:NAD(P)-dependent oxidoreductase [Brachybacterium subflavum]
MRIFLAGGSGVIGRRLIPRLVEAGHTVTATTRREATLEALRALGARGVVVDVYDAQRLTEVVAEDAPDLVLHELTDLGDADTDANARLRREGTEHLVAAARAAGVERMLVQSIAWAYAEGGAPAVEEDPLVPGSAVAQMEDLVATMPRSTVLRYGMLYGPSTWYAPGGRVAGAVSAGMVPATEAITSFVHVEDAVSATVQALDWADGTFNIVDDEPAAATTWLPVYASGIGAPAPAVQPLPDGAPRGRGASNAKARAAGWRPLHPSWRESFRRP